jgi:hypothetical protein
MHTGIISNLECFKITENHVASPPLTGIQKVCLIKDKTT